MHWAQNNETNLWLDSNESDDKYGKFEGVLAIGVQSELNTTAKDSFQKLKTFRKSTNDYLFGYLSYDLKNDVEDLQSNNDDRLMFPDLYFFQPQKILFFTKDKVRFEYLENCKTSIDSDYESIVKYTQKQNLKEETNLDIKPKIEKVDYLKKTHRLLSYIQKGDLYEANFCQEFYAENAQIDPLAIYEKLNSISTPPFACFVKIKEHYIVSASPERYLKKTEHIKISTYQRNSEEIKKYDCGFSS